MLKQELSKISAINFCSSGLLLTYHAGVALQLKHSNKKFDKILGTSGGALIGALFCCNPNALENSVKYMLDQQWKKNMSFRDFLDPANRIIPNYFGDVNVLPEDRCIVLRFPWS